MNNVLTENANQLQNILGNEYTHAIGQLAQAVNNLDNDILDSLLNSEFKKHELYLTHKYFDDECIFIDGTDKKEYSISDILELGVDELLKVILCSEKIILNNSLRDISSNIHDKLYNKHIAAISIRENNHIDTDLSYSRVMLGVFSLVSPQIVQTYEFLAEYLGEKVSYKGRDSAVLFYTDYIASMFTLIGVSPNIFRFPTEYCVFLVIMQFINQHTMEYK